MVLYHAGVPFLGGGYVGVDVFFVISGFLITGHLVTQLRENGTIKFSSFYAKRIRRILPASLLVLVLSLLAALIWFPHLLLKEVWLGAVATALYVPNFLFAAQGTNYLAETTPSLFQHYWSLGIEEQFYLVWPVILLALFVAIKSTKHLLTAVALLTVLSFAACVYLTYDSQPWAFFSLPTRAWELGVGGLVAILLAAKPAILSQWWATVLGWVGIFGIIGSVFLFQSSTPFPSFWAAVPVLSVALVILSGTRPARFGPTNVLATPLLMKIGLISYSLYLVHWPLLQISQAAIGYHNPLPLWATLLLAALSVPVAWLLFTLVEEPFRKGRWLPSTRPRGPILTAGAAAVVVTVVATSAYGASLLQPLHDGRKSESYEVSAPPNVTAFVPSNLHPTLSEASSDQPSVYDDGCHLLDYSVTAPADCLYGDPSAERIVLFGDSHAAQWFPAVLAFAQANGYSVEPHTKSSCPSADLNVLLNSVPYSECEVWRDAVKDRLDSDPPRLVIISNYGQATLPEAGTSYSQQWRQGLEETIREISPIPVAVIADTPSYGSTPAVCLSGNLDTVANCATPVSSALESEARDAEEQAAISGDFTYIDMTEYMCGPSMCSPILGDILAFRDAHHITATFSRALAPALGSHLSLVLEQDS